jgi:hypothetical protein
MKTIVLICLIAFHFLGYGSMQSFSQENKGMLDKKSDIAEISQDTNNSVAELLFIADIMRMAHMDCEHLIPFDTGIGPLTQSYARILNSHSFYYSSALQMNSEMSLMYQYRKIDVSKSKNLDYKSLSNKYPKINDLGNNWGGLLYDIIYMGTSSSHFTRGK